MSETIEKTVAEKLAEGLQGLPSESEIRIQTAEDLREEKIPEPDYIIDGILEKNDLFFFTGKSKSGKSTCIINMAVALSTGIPFAGRPCKPCNVLLISLEDKDLTVKRRVKNCMRGWNVNPGDKLGFVYRSQMLKHTLDGNKTNLEVVTEILQNDNLKGQTGRPLDYYDVIIIDPFYYLAEAIDENNSKEMGRLARDVRNLAGDTGRTLIVTAHAPKGDISGRTAQEGISGSGTVGRIAETYILLKPHEKNKHVIATYTLRGETIPEDEVWSLEDYPLLKLAPDEDPTAYKKGGGGTGGRPKVYTEEKVLSLFPDLKKEFDTAEIIDMCRKKYNMSQTTAERLLRELRDSGELVSEDGKYRRKFTPNENV